MQSVNPDAFNYRGDLCKRLKSKWYHCGCIPYTPQNLGAITNVVVMNKSVVEEANSLRGLFSSAKITYTVPHLTGKFVEYTYKHCKEAFNLCFLTTDDKGKPYIFTFDNTELNFDKVDWWEDSRYNFSIPMYNCSIYTV